MCERLDLGEEVGPYPQEYAADIDAYRAATAGIKWLGVEQFIVLDDLLVAGTADCIGRLPDGRIVIADIKTGSIDYGGLSIAIQLACYANGVAYDVATGQRTPLDVDTETGVVVHLPSGSGTCTLHDVDLYAGWDAAVESVKVRDLRKMSRNWINILGGGHCYFAESNFNCSFGEGTCSPNPTISRAEQQDAAQDFSLMWLNFYLKNDCAAWSAFQDSVTLSNRVNAQMSCAIASPVISANGNQLNSTAAATYQWLLNGIAIPGEVNQSFTPAQNGMYEVVVTYNASPCPDTSNQINWVTTGTAGINALEWNVFPVPADDQLNLIAANSGPATIGISDMTRSKSSMSIGRKLPSVHG